MCEGCGLKLPNYGLASEGKMRWCAGCGKAEGAVSLQRARKICEGCGLHNPNYGLASEGKKRWCVGCGNAEGAVLIQKQKVGLRRASVSKRKASKTTTATSATQEPTAAASEDVELRTGLPVLREFAGATGDEPAWYAGHITWRRQGSWHVRYDDGDTESFVESSPPEMRDLRRAVVLATSEEGVPENTVVVQNAMAARVQANPTRVQYKKRADLQKQEPFSLTNWREQQLVSMINTLRGKNDVTPNCATLVGVRRQFDIKSGLTCSLTRLLVASNILRPSTLDRN
jgi:hypothetical protein